ncbi:aliphatic sulfonate ABC transporter substrate-binding protein [Methylopila sp. M107]|uniref:aliphatic sulfonate ABC transporter substrate-binding protein n=1 Tax=Methylopila sp. M107 TaxID=1101190 RepID=UPI0018CAB258|nr:aliphatic sulfonate ABC transporter substrate-binding protein [Methylopila sp. M107]
MLGFAVAGAALTGLPSGPRAAETLRIGYQKSSTLISLLKASGELEKALASENVKLSWHEFTSGLPLLEALSAGHVDFSADVADTVPIFAQAAGGKLLYVAEEAPSPTAQAILVPAKSEIAALDQLKGAKIAVTKGAGSHYLLLAALAKAGLSIKDVSPAYLTPADGRAAFVSGNVDAFVVWDPFLASAQAQTGARVLANGEGLASYKRYYLTTEAFAQSSEALLNVIFEQLKAKGAWVKAHPKEAAEQLAAIWKIDAAVVEAGNARRSYRVGAVTREGLSEQQKIADVFFAEGLFPKAVVAAEVPIWRPAAQ